MLQTALIETQSALGAHTARIQLVQQIPDTGPDVTPKTHRKNDSLNTDEDELTKFDNNESD